MRTPFRKARFGKGFTLIELLIVIAIILILIAIALPNFLEAQIRARVTKAKAEMRTIETAMMSYFLDWAIYPPEHERSTNNHNGRGFDWLTSPISYVRTTLQDPFAEFSADSDSETFITYEFGGVEKAGPREGPNCDRICTVTWTVFSNGPDVDQLIWGNNPHRDAPGREPVNNYSATNGTKSRGSIYKWGGDTSWIGVEGLTKDGSHDLADRSNIRVVGRTVDGITYFRTSPPNL